MLVMNGSAVKVLTCCEQTTHQYGIPEEVRAEIKLVTEEAEVLNGQMDIKLVIQMG